MSDPTPTRRRFPVERTPDGILVVRLPKPRIISWSGIEPEYWRREVVPAVDALPGRPWVLLDASAWVYTSSQRNGDLFRLALRAAERGGRVVVCGLYPDVEAVLALIGPKGTVLLPRFATVDEAVARLRELRAATPEQAEDVL